MKHTIVVGTQWGDEGKAKIVDYLAAGHDIVVRFNGGANAGHTSCAQVNGRDIKFVFHLMPAGALYEGKKCVVGNGVVLDPAQLLKEIDDLDTEGITVKERLYISGAAHLVMPWHFIIDLHRESVSGSGKIGTTGRGIGPAYADKASRTGIRMCDTLCKERFLKKFEKNLSEKMSQYPNADFSGIDVNAAVDFYCGFGEMFKDRIIDTTYFLHNARNEAVLFEGAQATFLDIDHGTYPYVTSSNASAGGACTGTGAGPLSIGRIVGIAKAYTTRVGEGAFPSELVQKTDDPGDSKVLLDKINSGNATESETGAFIRASGHEYGATTGRPRRCGWIDLVMLKKAVIVNSISEIALTKLDVLDGLSKIKACVAYETNNGISEEFPLDIFDLETVRPVYKTFSGWDSVNGIIEYHGLPEAAKEYIAFIEEYTGVPVNIVSVGPDRRQTIIRGKSPGRNTK